MSDHKFGDLLLFNLTHRNLIIIKNQFNPSKEMKIIKNKMNKLYPSNK